MHLKDSNKIYSIDNSVPQIKNYGAIFFYIFIIIFILLAYLINNGTLSSFFNKKSTSVNKKVIQIGYKQKEYTVDYTQELESTAIELSGFEEEENWNGDYITDEENRWEGKTSYIISSKNNQPTILSINKSVNLTDYNIFKLLIYSEKENNTNNIRKLTLRFGDREDTAYYEYDIRSLKSGWNMIRISKDNFTFTNGYTSVKKVKENISNNNLLWEKIKKISIELDSLPKSHVELSLDRLWAETDEEYKKDFLTPNSGMLSAQSLNNRTYINFWAHGGTLSLISEITSVRNFSYTAKIIPQRPGSFGINGRTDVNTGFGYYLDLGGIGVGSWQLYKIGKVVDNSPLTQLDNGTVANFQVEVTQPVWLRISIKDDRIAGYLSADGINFTKLTEKKDSEIESGGIGLQTANASFLLESVEFKQ